MDIIIIGCGPSGLMCAYESSKNENNNIIMLEANEKIGKKLFITGKGRCNVCNNSSVENILNNVVNNNKFLMSSLNKFSALDTITFFEKYGVKLKTERGNRVFPVSDKSSDILKALSKALDKKNIKIKFNTNVEKVLKDNNGKFKIITNEKVYTCDALVVATGGKSYSSTGSKGKGYEIAKSFNHNIVPIKPALVPILLKNFDDIDLAGLTLKNVCASIILKNEKGKDLKFSQFGEMLFTHEGVSGPIILTLSSFVNKYNLENAKLSIDLKPALDENKIEDRLIRDFETNNLKSLKNYLKELLPVSLIDLFLKKCQLDKELKVNNVSKENRKKIVHCLKNFTFEIKSLSNIEFAIVSSGGIDVKEVNPKTMESKLEKNLFFVGEVLDVDALTGGYNIQISLSTGFSAGNYLSSL